MRWVPVLALVLLAATPARADVWADLAADQHAVAQLDAARADVDARKHKLERESADLAAQIERLKSDDGVRRDVKLQELLAAQKQKSDDLERLASGLRGRTSLLAGARRKLIADCDRALAAPSLPEARRLELARLRTAQAAALAAPNASAGQPLGVASAKDDPLDGPRELQDKADLLRDSGDKLRREVQRLALRIDGVERRRHLRERAGAIDEDLFGEAASNRHSPRVASTTFGGNRGGTGDTAQNSPGQTPTAGGATGAAGGGGAGGSAGGGAGSPAPGTGSSNGGGGPSGGTGGGLGSGGTGGTTGLGGTSGGDTTVLRNLVDPATLDELRRSDGGDDLDRQLRALRRAQGELSGLANELDRRARALSQRADELKHKK